MYYAQTDSNKICIGVSSLSGEVNNPNLIKIEAFDTSIMGKKYEDGVWVEVTPSPEPEPEETLSEIDQAILNMAINTEYLIAMQEGGF